jgi:hypothetical protein
MGILGKRLAPIVFQFEFYRRRDETSDNHIQLGSQPVGSPYSGIALLFHGDVIYQETMRSPVVLHAAGLSPWRTLSTPWPWTGRGCRVA